MYEQIVVLSFRANVVDERAIVERLKEVLETEFGATGIREVDYEQVVKENRRLRSEIARYED